jgi:hypothetical protein
VYLLYTDESGTPGVKDKHFVIGGIAIHESDASPLRRAMRGVVTAFLDEDMHSEELHAQQIRAGKGAWRKVPSTTRHALLGSLADLLGKLESELTMPAALFSIAWSPGAVPSVDPLERTFEELLLRFNRLLKVDGHQEWGIVICDKARYEATVQPLVTDWLGKKGTRFGPLNRIVEVPLFLDSKQSLLTQAADIIAHAVYRCYEADEPDLMYRLISGFPTDDDGRIHGLVHLTPGHSSCTCIACTSRREPPVQGILFESDA